MSTMSDSDKAKLKAKLFGDYRVKAAEAVELENAGKILESETGAVVDQIVEHFGPGPYKLDGNLVRARKSGDHYQFRAIPLDGAETV